MEEVLRFLEKYELWIYVLGGILGVFYLFRLVSAWQEWRTALFGLERESAQRRFSTAMTATIVIVIFVMAEFILISFVSPGLPQTSALPTPTLNLLATKTPVVAAAEGTKTAPTAVAVANALATVPANECQPGKVEWLEPKSGSEVSGTIALKGTVNVPDFGFYKYEYSTPTSNTWMTIAAGNNLVTAETGNELGVWNTSEMVPGDYLLRLVAVDNQNKSLPACVITIRILTPPQE